MIAVPAVDLKEGRCVQLVGGRPDDERVSLPDPIGIAKRWRALGFSSLHVVDLDGALDAGDNLDLVTEIAREAPGDLQVGGGIRDDQTAEALLATGADRIIVGTRAVDDSNWLARLADRYPNRVVVAADIKDGRVLRKGWAKSSEREVVAFLEGLSPVPLAGILCTDVGREGQVKGIDRSRVEEVLSATEHRVWISGGVTEIDELRFLRGQGAGGAVLGMALYTGVLDATQVAEEFGR